MVSFEWAHLAIGVVAASVSALGGLIGGVWRVARIEQAIRSDFKEGDDDCEAKMKRQMDTLVEQFRETFSALRQKINDVELQTEKLFMSKDGFNEFRREYREDMAVLMKKIDHITARADQ